MLRTGLVLMFVSFLAPAICGSASADVTIALRDDSPALRFGAQELSTALTEQGTQSRTELGARGDVVVRVEPSAVGGEAEAFAIRRDGPRVVVVGDEIGAMYGLLDLADSVALGRSLDQIRPRQARPFLAMRGLKWNMPLAGGAYAGDSGGKPGEWLWSRDFWEKHLAMVARNRYNVLTIWNGCPYHHLVRLDGIPASSDLDPAQIDANIAFFRWVTRRARELGIDTYVITWNIHVPPSFAEAQGIEAAGVDTPEVREYLREAIRALIDTYPDLTGIGTCPGERMRMSAQEKQDWIADVYFEGMRRASRKVPFFLRYWQGDPQATAQMLDRVKWPEPVYVSVKFNGEHMYSSPRFHLLDHNWLTMADRRWKVFWHLRNDCLFRLKWGDPEFVRETVHNCKADYSCGHFWGSEGLKPGTDGSHQPQTDAYARYDYEFERKSEMYALWGRLSYDPDTPNEVLLIDYRRRFGPAAEDAFKALAQASRVVPLTTSFHWNYMNGDWQPEHNIGSWNTSYEQSIRNYRDNETFHSVKEYIFNATIDDTLCSIPDFVTAQMTGRALPEGQLSPLGAAARIIEAAEKADESLNSAQAKLDEGNPHFACVAGDVRIAAELGRYYGRKMLAATHLGRLLIAGDEQARRPAVELLSECAQHWQNVVRIAAEQYPTDRWRDQPPQVQADIEYAQTVEPLPWRRTEWQVAAVEEPISAPGQLAPADWRETESKVLIEEGEGQGLTAWLARMNSALGLGSVDLRKATGVDEAAAYLVRRTFVAAENGVADIVLRTELPGAVWVEGEPVGRFGRSTAGTRYLSAPVQAGESEVLVQLLARSRADEAPLGLEVSVLPVGEVVARIECEAAERIEAPMVVVSEQGCSGGECVRVPIDAGRGDDSEGNPIDHGRMVLPFDVNRAGDYDVWARVFWPATTANSYFIEVDGSETVQFGQDEEFGRWHWVKSRDSYPLAAGEHRLVLRTRETNTGGDVVVIAPAR
jgi:hypothetical protein